MCKRFASRRVPPRHCRHQGGHRSPRVTRHAAATRRRAGDERSETARATGSGVDTEPSEPRPATALRHLTSAPAGRTDRSGGPPAITRPQTLSEPPRRGRRDCMWSLSRIGRVSSSASMPSGAVHASAGRPAPGREPARGRRGDRRHEAGVDRTGSAVAPGGPGHRRRCRRSRRRWRPRERGDALPTATRSRSPARDAVRSPGVSAVSGARRRPTEANCAVSAAVRRPPVDGRSWTTDSSGTLGRLAGGVSVAGPGASARRVPGHGHLLGGRATLRRGGPRPTGGAPGRRRVARSVHAVSSTPPRTTRTHTWQEPSAACRQPSSSPAHQVPA